jgi:hypothetical protein
MGRLPNELGEHRDNVVPEKDPYFLPPVRAFGNGEVKVRIDKLPGLDVDDHTSQNHCFCI